MNQPVTVIPKKTRKAAQLPELNLDISQRKILIGRAKVDRDEAKKFAESILKLAIILGQLDE